MKMLLMLSVLLTGFSAVSQPVKKQDRFWVANSIEALQKTITDGMPAGTINSCTLVHQFAGFFNDYDVVSLVCDGKYITNQSHYKNEFWLRTKDGQPFGRVIIQSSVASTLARYGLVFSAARGFGYTETVFVRGANN